MERSVVAGPQYVLLNPIGFPTSGNVTASVVADGGNMWNSGCNSSGIPTFMTSTPPGGAGYALVNVDWNSGISPFQGRCGSFSGNVVNIYQYTINPTTGKSVDCGAEGFAQNVAHELGHFLGLADDFSADCGTDIMAQVDGLSHQVSGSDCSMADSLNTTPYERNNGCVNLEDCRQSPIIINLDD
ncbi:MAG: hypothetical protein JOZ15_04550, partial [Acidobacteria bacterium]|nr:hypothetical protein [Acidobacteriota bacterium]